MRRWISQISICFIAVGMILTMAGCTTLADAQRARGTGQSKIYNAPAEKVWDAMQSVITAVGLDYVGENRTEGYVLAQRGISLFSYGENVAIYIEAPGESNTRVEVVSKKAMATNVFAPNWSGPIFRQLDQRF